MNIEAIKNYWQHNGEKLYVLTPELVDKTKVNNETFEFLTTCGLPADAAPFLSFKDVIKDQLLTPNQIFNIESEGPPLA